MKFIKLYEDYDNIPGWQIPSICKYWNITNYTINKDDTVDVDTSVYLSSKNLSKLPLRFGKVNGNFYCNRNNLTTLEGSPKILTGFFHCSNNLLTSFEGAPSNIRWELDCARNLINSFEGFPQICKNVTCIGNPIYKVWELFFDTTKIELFNEFDIIRGNDLILDRLNDFLVTIGKKTVEYVEGYNLI